MRQIKVRLLAGVLWLLAFVPAQALPFHETYGRSIQFGELTSVASTSVPGAIASGNFSGSTIQGVLLKVLPTGTLAWVQAYGPTQIAAARETPAGGFAWIGTGEMEQPQGSAPVVAGVDPMGTTLWERRLRLPLPDGTPADRALGSFLEIDPKDGGVWVGGEVWFRTSDDPQPWLARLDRDGRQLWVKTLVFPANARFHAIFPALDGGILAVGEIWAPDATGKDHVLMLAVKLGAGGNFVWAFQYRVQNAEPHGEQRLSDLDRDPRFERPESAVVGTIAAFCKSVPSVPCDPVESAAFVATLDETTGRLSHTRGLFSSSRPKTFGETIAMNLVGEAIAVGGEVAAGAAGSRQGLLALLPHDFSVVRKASLHSAGAGFDGDLRSLDVWHDGNDFGYLFLLNESYSEVRFVPTLLRSLVRTDRDGNSGSCEQCTEVKTFEAWLEQSAVQFGLRDGASEPIEVPSAPFALVEAPCGLRPCVG